MKKRLAYGIKTVFVLAVILEGSVGLACRNPDFARVSADLARTRTVDEAMRLRQGVLRDVCDLEGLETLSRPEPNSTSEAFFTTRYLNALANFALDSLPRFTKNREIRSVPPVNLAGLYRRMLNSQQSVRLRETLIPMARSCEDFTAIIYPSFENPVRLDRAYAYLELYSRYAHIYNCQP